VKGMTALLVLLLFSTACVTQMTVTTDVYCGPLPPDPVVASAEQVAQVAESALATYRERALEAAVTGYLDTISQLQSRFPSTFGSASSLQAYGDSARQAFENALAPAIRSAETARAMAGNVRAAARAATPSPSSDCLSSAPDGGLTAAALVTLRDQLIKTASIGKTALRAVSDAEMTQYESVFVQLERSAANAAAEERRRTSAMLTEARAIVRAHTAPEDSVLEAIIVAHPLSLVKAADETIHIPLSDPAVPIIVAAAAQKDSKVWRPGVNGVRSFNQFGNAEIAFRMDGLGDSHLKSVIFDPSQAMKTGFAISTKALEVTAAAFGGASFAQPARATGTGTPAEPTTAPALTTKPAIDAEILRMQSSAALRREAIEALFWEVVSIGKGLPATATDDASAQARSLLTAVNCAKNEIADPQGRQCGGEE
jgi:hypothetical protein